MKLKILTDEMLTDLKGNFESYKHHYKDETNNWFLQHFNQNNGLIESKIECNDFILNTDDDYNISDYEKELLLIFLLIPHKIEKEDEYDKVVEIVNIVDKLAQFNDL